MAPASSDERVVRVFISSTFLDFTAEREALAVRVFPELRRRAQPRYVHVTPIDLQWGVSQAEARDNKQLERCIREIDRCDAYFLGMIGERYGWAPPQQAFTPAILEARPWLQAHVGRSITELEIRCGCLAPNAHNSGALLFARAPQSNGVSGPDVAAEYRPLIGELQNCGYSVQPHADIDSFVGRAIEHLWALIDRDYPAENTLAPHTDEERRHRGFGRERAWAVAWRRESEGHFEEYLSVCRDGGCAILRNDVRHSYAVLGPTEWDAAAYCAYLAERARQIPEARVFEHHPPAGVLADSDLDFLVHFIRFCAGVTNTPAPVPGDLQTALIAAASACASLTEFNRRTGMQAHLFISGVESLSERVRPVLETLALDVGGLLIAATHEGKWSRSLIDWRLPWAPMNLGHDEFEYFVRAYIERQGKSIDLKPMYDLLQQLRAISLLHYKQTCDYLIRYSTFATLRDDIKDICAASGGGDRVATASRIRLFAHRARQTAGADEVDRLLAELIRLPAGDAEEALRIRSGLAHPDLARVKSALGFALDEWRDRIWLVPCPDTLNALMQDGRDPSSRGFDAF